MRTNVESPVEPLISNSKLEMMIRVQKIKGQMFFIIVIFLEIIFLFLAHLVRINIEPLLESLISK
jgi:hypothetical protein